MVLDQVAPLLEAEGHRVLTPELPGTGGDQSDPSGVTLDGWARFTADVITLEAEPVVLAGHSRGGIVISRTAELIPEKLRRLVYVSGYLLQAGSTLADVSRQDEDSLVPPNMLSTARGVACRLQESVIREALFGECTKADYEFALARMTPEPLKPLVTRLRITGPRFGRVPRAYIECSRDRTITLEAQRKMQAALPCDPVFTLDTDHSPFLSQPEALARLLGGL